MSLPTTRAQFKEYCLRALGKPVIEINVDDDHVDDRIDQALQYWWDYHFDGSEKVYYKYNLAADQKPGCLSEVIVIDGGTGYTNNSPVTFNVPTGGNGSGATGTIVTEANVITSVTISDKGNGYTLPPTVSVSGGGSGANLQVLTGGYIPIPDNIIGAVNIFDIGDAIITNNLFNIRYQIILNDLYTLTSTQMAPYYMAMSHLQFIEQMLVGKQPIRYNRHQNRLYLDCNWDLFSSGRLIVVEAYQIVDPDIYTDAWHDRWLLQYATCLIKQQWGNNTKKYGNMMLPGGIVFNGQKIYDEATEERKQLEYEMISSYSLPVLDMIGAKPFYINKKKLYKGEVKQCMDLFTSGEMPNGMIDAT